MLKRIGTIFGVFILLGIIGFMLFNSLRGNSKEQAAGLNIEESSENFNLKEGEMIKLPEVVKDGQISLEKALTLRRSIRSYASDALSLSELSQLLWSAQGITNERGFRTAPSAGATFPLEMFVVVNNVNKLNRGIYHYNPHDNTLKVIHLKDISAELMRASLSQSMITEAGAVLVFGAIFERTMARYGERGIRYVHNEIGHASQNVHLQAAALDLGTVVIGAYRDEEVEEVLNLDPEIKVLYMMPVGKLK
ncbi:MAG: SagB/ThcOx family dehydrogenase [Bacteroidales bacterium]|nr:SagB/ThcOx family dehydrogenase [Bacteroidales bacterium]